VALSLGGTRGAGSLTYHVPDEMPIRPGDLVLVPLQTRVLPGVVVSVVGETPGFPTRSVEERVAEDAFVGPLQLTLARWIAAHYRAPLYDCLALFLPPGLAARLANAAKNGTWKAPATPLIPVEPPVLPPPLPGPPLTVRQAAAARRIVAAIEERQPRAFLLHGVTGSGKTHVYLEAVARTLEQGRQAVVLVPEIGLTPAMLARLEERFPERVALIHSQLPITQHRRSWERVRTGEADIVVGSRSALFAPIRRPGLVILDEEQEPSYHQESHPRYHAREVALWWGQLAKAPVVLGSATPDVESYFRAERGRYTLLTLPTRFQRGGAFHSPPWGSSIPTAPSTLLSQVSSGAPPFGPPQVAERGETGSFLPSPRRRGDGGEVTGLPPVSIVDLREELKAGNTGLFSRELSAELSRVLARGEQALLLLNRRGTATCVSCRDCGHVVTCPRCDIAVVYHRSTDALICHRCNRRRSVPERCPDCLGRRIRFLGSGTQRVEQELAAMCPDARVVRWDRDSTRKRGESEEIWRAFRAGEADIMVGTQMIAKALDFPRVTLVGIVLADIGLFLPDFRAGERTFQLLSQMAGRSGRGELAGRAIIQTYVPDHYAIRAAAAHDYAAFYAREVEFRRAHGYPPLGRLVRLLFSAAREEKCIREVRRVRSLLDADIRRQGIADIQVIGPAPCFAERARGRYRWALLLRGDRFARLLDKLDLPPGWTIDVDPVSLL
jgi:primosomal protein N' (replication factor Y) (superfamily II helicase)